MKTTLKYQYDFDDLSDVYSYEILLQAGRLYDALSEYSAWLREVCKYGEPTEVTAEACREKFWEIINENRVNLEL